ncbi:MAG: twin-arginine translocase subunit TatC [Gammaproteobacteria bacterium]|nr:twin-arginine translocase subunit TatC [Gammaproteobacteria bacterium]
MSHLIELRQRLVRILIVLAVILACLLPFSNPLYTRLAAPLTKLLPVGSTMIAVDVSAPFMIPFKLVTLLAVFLAIPYLLYEIWGFVAPGLYRHEKSLVVPILTSATILFYAGVAFAYFVVFPLLFSFIVSMTPEGVSMMTDMSSYLDFVMAMFLAFGVIFEVPIVIIVLVSLGIVSIQKLVAVRRYFIVFAFIIGMLLTPPDVISQTLLAVPMCILFEVGVLCARVIEKRKIKIKTDQALDVH